MLVRPRPLPLAAQPAGVRACVVRVPVGLLAAMPWLALSQPVPAPADSPPAATATAPAVPASAASAAAAQTPARPPARRVAPPMNAASAAPAGRPQTVEITGTRTPTDERRQSTAAKIVIGREEIEQYGDLSLADVMRRLPSVTLGGRPGRGGSPRMRGMGSGYTQILVDGDRLPPGMSLDQIPPDLVERIEIYRAPTAETGARAVAGTINIVLREPLRQTRSDLRVGVSHDRRGVRPNASLTRNDVLGERGTWNLTLNASGSEQRTLNHGETQYRDAASDTLMNRQLRDSVVQDHRQQVSLTGRLQWRLGEAGSGEHVTVQPFLSASRGHSRSDATLEQSDGRQSYDTAQGQSQNRTSSARLTLNGRSRVGEGARLEWRAAVGQLDIDNSGALTQFLNGVDTPVLIQATESHIRDRSWSAGAKLSFGWTDQHALVLGLEGEGVRRTEDGLQRSETTHASISGTPVAIDIDGDLRASTRRVAVYLQDEWTPAPRWAVNAGARWEEIRTHSDALAAPVDHVGRVLAPMGHLLWRFGGDDPRRARDQLRLSLTRSYRAPSLGQLTSLPRFNTVDPVPGGNTASTPDRAGNPSLKPELAAGLDLALEHYLGTGGVLSASVFHRRIQGMIRSLTALETVSWAGVPRWVNRPRNTGDATSSGIELDGKARIEELLDEPGDWRGLSLRANLGLYRSRVDGVPAPDNRIDQQPDLSLNLGGDYRFAGGRWMVGANLSRVPGYAIQISELQRNTIGGTRVIDAFVQWSQSPDTRWRLSVSNLAPIDYRTTTTLRVDPQRQVSLGGGPTYRVLQLRWEQRL